eukprot:GEMP01054928.1.p1 GENE.GEMP01054928.1~~GEMP01054928.1.p1  ORF type:complete len:281 (-),score=47.84 GEMP01054928.1:598-1440(-)
MFGFSSAIPTLVDQVSFALYDVLTVVKSGPVGIVNACVNGTWNTLIYSRSAYPMVLMIPFILHGVRNYRRNQAFRADGNHALPGMFFQAIFCFFLCCYPGTCVSEPIFQHITPRCLMNENVLLVFTVFFVSTHFSPFVMRVCENPVVNALIRFGFSVDLTRTSMMTLERSWDISRASAVWSSILFFCAGPLLRQIAMSAPVAQLGMLPAKSFVLHLLLLVAYYATHRYFYQCTASLDQCGNRNPQCFIYFAFAPTALAMVEVLWSNAQGKLERLSKKKKT